MNLFVDLMRLTLAYKDDVRLPSRGTINTLVELYRKTPPITTKGVQQATRSESRAKAFLVQAEREGLMIRGKWGEYYPVPPHVALWSSLLMDYYRDLFRMHGALDRASVPHAFACLTASEMADYVPGRPITVVAEEHFERFVKADVFGLALSPRELRTKTHRIGFTWPDSSYAMNIPALSWDWTSLVLGAIGLRREMTAAKQMIKGREREIDDLMSRRLNSVGLSPRPDTLDKTPSVLVPVHILRLRQRYAESLRQLDLRKE